MRNSLVQVKFYVPDRMRGEFLRNSPFPLSGGLNSSLIIDGVPYRYLVYNYVNMDDSDECLKVMIQYYLRMVSLHHEECKYFFYSVNDVMVRVSIGEDSLSDSDIQFKNIDELSMEEVLNLIKK